MGTKRPGLPTALTRFISGFVGAFPTNALIGAFTGFPAVITALLFVPEATAYVVFGIAGLVASRTTTAFRDAVDERKVPDSEELTAEEIRILFAIVVTSTTLTVSLQTGIAGGVAYWIAAEAGLPMLGLFIAVAGPLADGYMASIQPKLSIEYWAHQFVFACHALLVSVRNGDSDTDEKLTRIARRGPLL